METATSPKAATGLLVKEEQEGGGLHGMKRSFEFENDCSSRNSGNEVQQQHNESKNIKKSRTSCCSDYDTPQQLQQEQEQQQSDTNNIEANEYKEMFVESQNRASQLEKQLQLMQADNAKLEAKLLAGLRNNTTRRTTTTTTTTTPEEEEDDEEELAKALLNELGRGSEMDMAHINSSSCKEKEEEEEHQHHQLVKQQVMVVETNNNNNNNNNTNITASTSTSTIAATANTTTTTTTTLSKDEEWDMRFNELQDYKRVYGHCDVPRKYVPNRQLGIWCMTQRTQYKCLMKKGRHTYMTSNRIIRLNAIGFCFDKKKQAEQQQNKKQNKKKKTQKKNAVVTFSTTKDSANNNNNNNSNNIDDCSTEEGQCWESKYAELMDYYRKYGNCSVPLRYSTNPALGRFVANQRAQYKSWQHQHQQLLMSNNNTNMGNDNGNNNGNNINKKSSSSSSMTQRRYELLTNIGFQFTLKQQDEEHERAIEQLWNQLYHRT